MKTKLKFWQWPDGLAWRMTEKITVNSRRKTFNLFMNLIQTSRNDKILDVGVSDFSGRGINFLEIFYPYKENITALGVGSEEDYKNFRERFPEVKLVIGDGRHLPFKNNSFDIGFSNAVTEHVGNRDNQRKFITEIIRVSKKCFIATPNYWFPVEFHTLLPFVHYLPIKIRFKLYKKLGKGYWADINHLNSLSSKELLSLISKRNINVRLVKQKFMGFTYKLILIIDKDGKRWRLQ